jgi:hypothetical protein
MSLSLRCWLWLAILTMLTDTAGAVTRVALVSTCGGGAGDDVLALAVAKLSADPGIVLVERAEVERILQEQKLTRCGLSGADQALAVGKLLGVDVFAALETYPDNQQILGLVVFDASSGVRLLDAVLPSGDTAHMGENVAVATQEACVKRAHANSKLRTVCVLSVRNAEFPRSMDSFCESVGQILERGLLGSASFSVSERERLEQVNKERSLLSDNASRDLLPSLTLLELEFSRSDESNGVKVTVLLTDSTGARLGKIEAIGNFEHTADLVESLLEKLTRALKASPVSGTMDRPREALRFRQEASLLMQQDQAAKALQPAEAACALDPEDRESHSLLAHTLLAVASAFLGARDAYGWPQPAADSGDNVKRAMMMADRAADLCLQIRTESSPNSVGNFFYPVPAQEAAFGGFLASARGIVQGADDELRREWTELQGKYRQLLLKRREQITAAASATPVSFLFHVWDLYWLIGDLEPASATSAAWTGDVVETLDRVLVLVDKFGVCNISRPGGVNLMLASILYRIAQPTKAATDGRGLSWNLDEADKVRLAAFFELLRSHDDPLLRLYGMAGEFAARVRKQSVQSEEITARLEEIKRVARETIASPPCQKPDDYRISVYRVLLDTIDLLPDPAMRRSEYQALFDFMLGRHEYVHWVAMAAVDPHARAFATYGYYASVLPRDEKSPGDPALCAQNLARLQALLDSPDCHKLIGPSDLWRGGLDLELQRVRQSIAEQQPGLIPSSPAPWSAARLLYGGSGPLQQPRVTGDSVWGLELSPNATHASLVRVPLDGRPAQRYDRIPDGGPPDKFYGVPVHDGLMVFPPSAAVSRFTEANGLPSPYVNVTACCDGKLYAGICRNEGYLGTGYRASPGYLVSCDPVTGRVKVLASSLRQEKSSALDDVPQSFFIRQMIADPERHRVLFTVDVGVYKRGASHTGIWSVDTTSDRLTCLLPMDGICRWIGPVHDHNFLYVRELRADTVAYEVRSFDLATNRSNLLGSSWPNKSSAGNKAYAVPWQSGPAHLLLDGWLWVGYPFCRIPADGGPRQFLPSFAKGHPTIGYDGLRQLELLENGRQILASLGSELWLLDLKSPSPAASTDSSKDSP